ncbi:hypothetical protein DCCM_2457 [Desulfocucumis palustris]|uniref:Uncharacterized protein n=1 Tax=Desulfocucumis palustris TaxID=1898651 RepID=A0A2L2XGL4_9FIRM|nr:hypothetical protein [Desulfocucumis palustris]GBF33356.1 hypothetical protein DCCM_2457 [Desulfocucumis palustris]
MPYKDPDKKREYMREYQRMRKTGIPMTDKTTGKSLNPEDIQNARGLLVLLSETMADVVAAKADTLSKARVIGYLVSIGLKAVETAELAARIDELEEQLRRYH